MNCLTCQESFTEMLENSDSPIAVEAAAHLESCPACARAFAAFGNVVGALHRLPPVAPPRNLSAAISVALDGTTGPQSFCSRHWQPLTTVVSMAACCLLVLWTVVLNPVHTSQFALHSPGAGQPARAPSVANVPSALLPSTARASQPYETVGMPARPVAHSTSPGYAPAAEFGTCAAGLETAPRLTTISSTPVEGPDKPAGTFAATDETPAASPLHKSEGPIILSFQPPPERLVGELLVGEVIIESQAEANVTLTVEPKGVLRVNNLHDGVLYQGPIRRGDKVKLPVRMVAGRPGGQRMHLSLKADVPGVAAELDVNIPDFKPQPPNRTPEPLVTLIFDNVSSVRAIREMAAAANQRVVIHEGVEPEFVTQDYSKGVPFAAALRILCDGCGYRVEEREGVYHILK